MTGGNVCGCGLLWLDWSMTRNRIWLWIVFLGCLGYVGLPYWTIPYQKVSLPGTFFGLPMFAVALSAFLLGWFRNAEFWKIVLVLGSAMPAAVLLRVMIETHRDPTSHNLWPLEMVIAAGVGMIGALAGTALGAVAAPLLQRRKAEEREA
jgi:hypothetical protein